MVLNYIWITFFVVAFVVALIRLVGYYFRDFFAEYTGVIFNETDLNVFSDMVQSTFDMAETSVSISVYLIGIMALWLGIMKIGENAGAVNILSRMAAPLFSKLFPDIPKNHPAYGAMLMNISANMLGLDNAATPLGLKAMSELQKENKEKNTASNSQIMFLVLNTSGLTLIPVSVIALRASAGSQNPTDIFIPILLATYFSTLAGLIIVSIYQRINLFNKTVLLYLGGITAVILGLVFYFYSLPQDQLGKVASVGGNFILFFIIVGFISLAVKKKINVYDSFVSGAKSGFGVAVKIIPYLVAMLVAIGVFRASGAMDFIIGLLESGFSLLGINTDFVGALPTAMMKPLSGSGARGLMVESWGANGELIDSFVGKLTSIMQGSTETTFYTIAVYFGSVGVRKTRHTVTCGLFADLVGVIAAILIGYMFFH